MKPMKVTETDEIPKDGDWIFETKYDGFRCLLFWDEDGVSLFSRNERLLNENFPEIIDFCTAAHKRIGAFLPLTLDGEIVHLKNDHKSEFTVVQRRGRLRKQEMIFEQSRSFPCKYIAFDVLESGAQEFTDIDYEERRKKLQAIFRQLEFPVKTDYRNEAALQMTEVFMDSGECWREMVRCNGEGMIAKKRQSRWTAGQRTADWLKIKNWRKVHVVLSAFEEENGYFSGVVFREEDWIEVVTFKHGLSEEEEQTLRSFFYSEGRKNGGRWEIAPSVCMVIRCIDFDGRHLREPRFDSFDFEMQPEQCTWRLLNRELLPIPVNVEITHPDKPVWRHPDLQKDDYILYLQQVSPFLLPIVEDRPLTCIRYPHGTLSEERFFQKNVPEGAPTFVQTVCSEDIDYIVCNDIETLLWLGNQLALEFHIPFQTYRTDRPMEIVFDLDPPSVEEFSLAVEAALWMKAIFDQFRLRSFVKTSGGKGLQLYIPLPYGRFTYDETRVFTKFIADFLCEQVPEWFTTERMKKNRGSRLYVDYVQHGEGKTIISPYSVRGNREALVATPLNWEEVHSTLHPSQFPIPAVVERLKTTGDLFHDFRQAGEEQPFGQVLSQLEDLL